MRGIPARQGGHAPCGGVCLHPGLQDGAQAVLGQALVRQHATRLSGGEQNGGVHVVQEGEVGPPLVPPRVAGPPCLQHNWHRLALAQRVSLGPGDGHQQVAVRLCTLHITLAQLASVRLAEEAKEGKIDCDYVAKGAEHHQRLVRPRHLIVLPQEGGDQCQRLDG